MKVLDDETNSDLAAKMQEVQKNIRVAFHYQGNDRTLSL